MKCPYCSTPDTRVTDSRSDEENCSIKRRRVCPNCGKKFTLPGILKIGDRNVLLTPKTKVYIDMDNKPDIHVISVQGDRYPVQLKNITSSNWTVETPSGKLKAVEPNQTMPVKAGLKVSLGGTTKGEII